MIAVAHDAALDIGGVGRCHRRLCHRKTRTNLAIQQGLQPPLLVFGRAVTCQHFHVAGVRRGTIEYLRRHGGTAHNLAQRRVFQICESGSILAARQEKIPETRGARLGLQRFDDARRFPAVVWIQFLVVPVFVGIDVLIHEALQPLLESLYFFGKVKMHGATPSLKSSHCKLFNISCSAPSKASDNV